MTDDPLDLLAASCGIEDRYRDAWGEWHEVPRERRTAILGAFGYDASTSSGCAEGLRRRMAESWLRPLPPVLAVRVPPAGLRVPLAVPDDLSGRVSWRIEREDGELLAGESALDTLQIGDGVSIDSRRIVRRVMDLPLPPSGYHRLTVDLPNGLAAETPLIVAPQRCHIPASLAGDHRVWGVAAQLYALRSARNWGMGDFGDLHRLVEDIAAAGGGVVGLNPLHALFPGNPDHCSPYTPSSRLGLNVLYIDVEAVPDFVDCPDARRIVADPAFAAGLAQRRSLRLVDYPAVAAAKLRVLRLLYATFRQANLRSTGLTERGSAFRAFQAGEGRRTHIAVFEALAEHFGCDGISDYHWRNWPEPFRDPSAQAVARFAADNPSDIEFHQYLQWLAMEQFRGCAAHAAGKGMAVGLYVDLALGADPDGADAWALRGVLAEGAAAGAPPDLLNLKGQDWGFAPFHPDALRAAGYRPFIDMLRSTMRDAGAIRIDHVLGLRRLYWVPNGHQPSEGGYVRYPLDELLAVVALESVRNRCLVVGEDLGTLPDGLREDLHDAALLSYRVLSFERDEDGAFRPPEAYPRLALVTAGTHDMATFPAYWRGDDLHLREKLDLFPSAETRAAAFSERPVERFRLAEALCRAGLTIGQNDDPAVDGQDPSAALIAAVHRFLARTPSMLLLAQIEDLIGETEPSNVPGTGIEYPNWRRTLALPMERIADDPRVQAVFALLEAERPARRPVTPRGPV